MRPPMPRTPSLIQTVRFLTDPVGLFRRCQAKYGPVFALKFLGFPAEVFVTDASLAEKVYGLDAEGGRAGELRRQFLEPVVGANSLLCLDGDPWRRHRQLLTPPLRARAIAAYRHDIAKIAADEIARMPVGRPIALRDHMQNMTLEVILRLVFGVRDTRRLERLRALLPALMDVGGSNLLIMTPATWQKKLEENRVLRRVGFLPSTKFRLIREAVDELLFEEIAQRRAEPFEDGTDVLSRLVAAEELSDQELRDELVTMLEAGHETTATGLAWAFERLLRTPDVLAKLKEEIAAGEEAYLDATVREALRSRPVVWDAPRLVDEPFELGGYTVPPGWMAAPLIALIHQDPDVYPQPEEFRPERFLGEEAQAANKAWMPFGGGRRYCVGAQLALMEMKVIIREVLVSLDLEAVGEAAEKPRMKHVTFVPARGGKVIVRSRIGSGTAQKVQEPV